MMPTNEKENLFFYHEVFAKSIAIILDLLNQGEQKKARERIIYNYIYALALNGRAFNAQTDYPPLKDMDIYDLFYLMTVEQKRADLTPTQSNYRDSFYKRILQGGAK